MNQKNSKPRLIVIVGPTASGKTSLGIAAARKLNGAVISADSRQVYSSMRIGTASPLTGAMEGPHDPLTPDAVDGIDHYLLNIHQPSHELTLADWQANAFKAIDHVSAQGQQPLLVGGTMLYVDSIVYNFAIPAVPPNQTLREHLEQLPTEQLYAQLQEQDPVATTFIEPTNTRRIIRALEVMAATGKPFSEIRQKQPPRYDVEFVGLFSNWDTVRDRIEARAREMINDGLIAETIQLRKIYGADLPLLKTLNYRQAGEVLDGTLPENEFLPELVRVNMRYARRQMSWWRGRDDITWFPTPDEALVSLTSK